MKNHQSLGRRVAWMIIIWAASVLTLGAAALVIRVILKT
ncbi:DUF2474 domain-containing protein [Achromobacter spanius]|uniref:DUF2474 domain-containing protein n=2 Tax=Alcaligenaceae TaxID=506 RepID=A0AA42IY92_9BURK|nr:DUF2474 domain-containing protein [Achromobacter spanius]MDH0734808.1 DUF2474 domain-containing protein [Achromobacter spanius]